MPYFCASRLRLACETALRSTYSCRLEMRCSGTKSHYSLQDRTCYTCTEGSLYRKRMWPS